MAKEAKNPSVTQLTYEAGYDHDLPFSTPFSPVGTGTRKITGSDLVEALKDDGDYYGPTIPQLVTMRKQDGQARALYRLLTLPIRSAVPTSKILPAEGGEKEAEFIETALMATPSEGGMSITFQRFLSQVLMGLFDGFAAFEKVYNVPKSGPLKGKITLKKLAYRPSDTVTFITDSKGSFKGIRQQTFYNGKVHDVTIPKEYVFYYAAQEEERKFYGVSYFQSAFYHYDKKVRLYYLTHLAAQRSAVGTRVAHIPEGLSTAELNLVKGYISSNTAAQWMMLPDKVKLEILRESGAFDFLGLINHHNSQMSKSILATFFDKDQGAGKNEGTVVQFGAPGNDMFVLMMRTIMDEIAEQINHYIIPQLIDLNFSSKKYPKFTWGQVTDTQRSAIATAFDRLSTAGQSATVTPEFIRAIEKSMADEFGLDIDWDEIEREEEEEAQTILDMEQLPGQDLMMDETEMSLEDFSFAVDEIQNEGVALSAFDEDIIDMTLGWIRDGTSS